MFRILSARVARNHHNLLFAGTFRAFSSTTMASRRGVDIIYGCVPVGNPEREVGTKDGIMEALSMLKSHNVTRLDTAQMYTGSEAALGRVKAGTELGFSIDTKWKSGWDFKAWATYDKILSTAKESLETLGVKKVDVFYLHSPDVHVPFEETLKGVNEVHQQGSFERFGLSNFTPDQVRKVLDVCKKNGFVMPKVYQGNYNAAARLAEDELFPMLREHGISFFAYSPIAGGFLTKTRKFVEDGNGRFGKGQLYHKLYAGPKFLDFLDSWNQIAQDEGISPAEMAYRWTNYHSALKPQYDDAVIFGATALKQIDQTCKYVEAGPLSDKAAKAIDDLWGNVKSVAKLDNFEASQ